MGMCTCDYITSHTYIYIYTYFTLELHCIYIYNIHTYGLNDYWRQVRLWFGRQSHVWPMPSWLMLACAFNLGLCFLWVYHRPLTEEFGELVMAMVIAVALCNYLWILHRLAVIKPQSIRISVDFDLDVSLKCGSVWKSDCCLGIRLSGILWKRGLWRLFRWLTSPCDLVSNHSAYQDPLAAGCSKPFQATGSSCNVICDTNILGWMWSCKQESNMELSRWACSS